MFEKKARVAKPKRAMWARDGRKKGPNVISFSVKSPADAHLGFDDVSGAYLMDDGSIGVIIVFDEDEECDDEFVGTMLIDCWCRDGTTDAGARYDYREGEPLKDWCDYNGYPLPVKGIPYSFSEALERGADAEETFAILDGYLDGQISDYDERLAALF